MINKIKIRLCEPGNEQAGRYFSLRLKQRLHNERSEYKNVRMIFVVSDIEGNFQAFRKLLVKNKVIDRNCKWTFGEGHLVILGDCFDRGEQVTECLWLIYSLEELARKDGGHVHFILGNHEIMNLNGDWRYVHPKYAEKQPFSRNPPAALYYGNAELWKWLQTKNIIEKIDDILFVHGGIANEMLALKLSVTEINDLARPYYHAAEKIFSDPPLYYIFNSELSPFWYRGYYQQAINEELVDATLAHFKVNTIITGHTVVDHITSFFNGKVINVDTDHSVGNSEALLIKKNGYYRVDNEGNRTKIK
ncbi:metallophosphoesterase [Longitalea luteola]|uniref:metallophosphoesterase n=1 Tax=Longitalea luteola TaxID=2812563 RepID=UPI001A96A251|nr:metallophosphoesterase [Longitalea luteola]